MTQEGQQPINVPMFELFQSQAGTHSAAILETLQEFNKDLASDDAVIGLINAANSIKQSAQLVSYQPAIELAHVMEDFFKCIHKHKSTVTKQQYKSLVSAASLLQELAQTSTSKISEWSGNNSPTINNLSSKIAKYVNDCIADDREVEQDDAPTNIEAFSGEIAAPPADTHTDGGDNEAASASPASSSAPIADESMLELFRIEVESLTNELSQSLLELEANPDDLSKLESMMRASHSIKGAARMVNVCTAVDIAHAMEDCFVAAQQKKLSFDHDSIDALLVAVDYLEQLAVTPTNDLRGWMESRREHSDLLKVTLHDVLSGNPVDASVFKSKTANDSETGIMDYDSPVHSPEKDEHDRVLRVTARRINTLMGLSSEFVVASTWIGGHAESLLNIKRKQSELVSAIDRLRGLLEHLHIDEQINDLLGSAQSKADECRTLLSNRLNELEDFDRRTVSLAGRMNHEVLASRMRPFADGVQGMQRMVRDLSRSLGKKIELVIEGMNTQVDRDILERIEAPLNHIIRNAIDHGIGLPEERIKDGKNPQGTIKLSANHSSGMLSIRVSDDGRGIDLEKLRERIVEKNMVHDAIASDLSESELLEFLFLPGFSTRDLVTELSGRGVGLDVAHSVVQEMRGKIRASTKYGRGTQIHLQLPLTLSVVRCLLVQIAGEPYAFPLARIESVLDVPRGSIRSIEDRQYIIYEHENIGLVDSGQVLDTVSQPDQDENVLVVVIGDRQNHYGLVIEKSLGEHSLAIQPLESKLGKVRDISAAAVLNDGSPVLIIDVDDMLRSIENLVSGNRLSKVQQAGEQSLKNDIKRILVVDDSLTVREVERKLLETRGYHVDVAVDGMDGWNTVRVSDYDLVITDVDMPRMNGIEFVKHIKEHPKLKDMPVMIVSYKDRDEDRQRGLDVGADYYLTKGSFHDDSLLDAVIDLIGYATK